VTAPREYLLALGYTEAEIDDMEDIEAAQREADAIDAALEDHGHDTLAEEHEFYEEARRETWD
jgi:hypothetical protein